MKFKFLLTLCFIFSSSLFAGAYCDTDKIRDYDLLKGRNAWAKKCGYIPSNVEEYYNSSKMFKTFEKLEGGLYVAPTDERMPCVKLKSDGACVLSQ